MLKLGSRLGALGQVLLDLLEDPNEICRLKKVNDDVERSVPLEKQIAEGKLCNGLFLHNF